MGTFQKKIQCQNCNNNTFAISQNNAIYSYDKFSYITFDSNEIYNFYSIQNNNNNFNNFQINNNFNQKINLNDCFKYCFIQNNYKYYTSYCNKCFTNTYQNEIFSLFSLSDILTIVLSNNQNSNILLEDELDLKQYAKSYPGFGTYLLISILCQINSNEFICYCVNPTDGSWYCYIDGKILRVQLMSTNDIPLILIYQNSNTFTYEYNHIKRDYNNKICLSIRTNLGNERKLFINKDFSIENVKKKISYYLGLKNKNFYILINGRKPKDDEILINALNNNNSITVFIQ